MPNCESYPTELAQHSTHLEVRCTVLHNPGKIKTGEPKGTSLGRKEEQENFVDIDLIANMQFTITEWNHKMFHFCYPWYHLVSCFSISSVVSNPLIL